MLVFGDLGAGDDLDVAGQLATTTPPVNGQAAPTPLDPMPTAPATPGTASPTPDPGATSAPGAGVGQIGAGVSIQVIAGANTTADQVQSAGRALEELGYDVTMTSTISGNRYEQTTVFASTGQDAQAEALVGGDPRFTVVGDNPGNLNPSIQIHVLVGEDWPVGGATADTPTEG
ncbi:hypothetical protein BH23ACT9_BH23ACT9_14820 [soil metagenome]